VTTVTTRPDFLEVVPTKLPDPLPTDHPAYGKPLSRCPHFVRRVDGHNGKTESTRQPYTRRDNAVRAAKDAAAAEGLTIRVLDRDGKRIKLIHPAR
jgi:hypothetical protein